MYVKIVTLKKQSEDAYAVDRTHVIECDEYQKYYLDIKDNQPPKERTLILRIIKNKECYREMVFDNPNLHFDIFIENSEGKTIGRLEYPRE